MTWRAGEVTLLELSSVRACPAGAHGHSPTLRLLVSRIAPFS